MIRFLLYSVIAFLPLSYYVVDVFPNTIWLGFGFALFFPLFLVWMLVRSSQVKKQVPLLFWRFAVSFILLSLSASFNFLLYEFFWLKFGLVFLVSFMFFLMLEHIYLYLYEPHRYETYSLGRIMTYVNILTVFFFAFAFYSIKVLLHLPAWIFILSLSIILLILITQTYWISAIEFKKGGLYIIISVIVVTQVFGIVALLPIGFYAQAFIVLAVLYVILRLTRHELFGNLDNRLMKRYAFSFILLTLAVLLTSKWI